jgi:hypothetical protein
MLNQKYRNVTRNQIVQVTSRGYNLVKKGDSEVSDGMKVEYQVIQSTSINPISEFVCTEDRFLRIYEKY